MSKKPQPTKPLKVVETFANFDEESQEDSANILQKVQFIGENYNFVQKEIQEILTRSEANEQKAQEYRDEIEDLKAQVEKERTYAKKLVNECQELRAGFYDMETRLSDTTEKHASLQLMEKELRIAVKKYRAEAADYKNKSEAALGKGKKVYQMLEDSKRQTAQLTQQLHTMRRQWTEEIEKLRKENAAFKNNTGQIKKDYESAESKLWQVIDENKKILIENRKLQSIFQQKDAAVKEMQSQLQARAAVVESRDRKIQELQEEIQGIHEQREAHLKARTSQLHDQVDSLKKICQRLRTELKSKSVELAEVQEKWKTFERVHRTEPAKRIKDLEGSEARLKKQLEDKAAALQKLREQEFRFQEEGRKVAQLEEEIRFLKGHVEDARTQSEDKTRQYNNLVVEKHKVDQELALAKTRAVEAEGKKQLMEQNLEAVKAEVSERQKSFETENAKSQKVINELQIKVSQLETEARFLGENRSQLARENESIQSRLNEIKKENEVLKAQNDQDVNFWKNQLAQTEAAKQKIQNQLDTVQSEITRSRARLQDVIEAGDQQKSEYEDFIHEQRGIIQTLEEQISKQMNAISDLKEANATLQNRLDVLQKRYESDADSWEQEEFQLRQKVTQLTSSQLEKDGQIASQSQALTELTLKVKEEAQRREMDSEKMQARIDLAQDRMEQISIEKEQAIRELTSRQEKQLTELTSRHGDIVHSLQSERDRIQKEMEAAAREASDEMTRQEVHWEAEKKSLQATINQLQQQNSELSRERQFEDDYENRLRLQYEEAQKKLAELRGRETQISNYSRLVDEQKFKLRRFADDLSQEVTSLQVLNPLKDYLELTNREIRDVELALSKTPALAAERKPMEQHFEKLVTQRDHLQKSLTESRQALQKKAKAVKDICRRAVLIPLPPLPPNGDDAEIS